MININAYYFPDGSYLDMQAMQLVAATHTETSELIMSQINRPDCCESVLYHGQVIQVICNILDHTEFHPLVDSKAIQFTRIYLHQDYLLSKVQAQLYTMHQPISTESISYVQYNQLKQTTDDLQQQLNLANQKIAMLTSEFHFEFNLLKQQNAELRCRRNGYPIAMAVPVAASAPVDLNDTKVHLARSISTQNLNDWQDQ